jgi:transposase
MDRTSLEAWLKLGLSLEEIGRRVGRHPSTVSYWIGKHGLEAAYRDRHAARGGIRCEQLEPLVEAGGSYESIAAELGVSIPSVRYWLKRHGLQTKASARRSKARIARARGEAVVQLECRHHGLSDFWLEGRGHYRCMRCRWEAVSRRRRKVKTILVAEAGGACCLCGYNRCVGALQFHHRDRQTKSFSLSHDGVTRSLERLRSEAAKCVLLCANCHAEVEAGVSEVS